MAIGLGPFNSNIVFSRKEVFLDWVFQAILDIGVVGILAWFLVRFIKIGETHLRDQESNNKSVDKTTVSCCS